MLRTGLALSATKMSASALPSISTTGSSDGEQRRVKVAALDGAPLRAVAAPAHLRPVAVGVGAGGPLPGSSSNRCGRDVDQGG